MERVKSLLKGNESYIDLKTVVALGLVSLVVLGGIKVYRGEELLGQGRQTSLFQDTVFNDVINEEGYKIIADDYIAEGNLYLRNITVMLNEELTVEEIESIGNRIIKNLEEDGEKPFNNLYISFVDLELYVDTYPTLGYITYSDTEGVINEDTGVDPGNYKNLEVSYNIKDKDWSERATEREALIWRFYHEKGQKLNSPEVSELQDIVTVELGITEGELIDALFAKADWDVAYKAGKEVVTQNEVEEFIDEKNIEENLEEEFNEETKKI